MRAAIERLVLTIMLLLSGVLMVAQTYITPVKSDLTPPTPQSARPIEYQMPQPSLLTGAVDLSIPIYTIVSGDLSLPISLQYHTNGIKVLDDPCPNGYGWSLMPALRATRTILGRPDEHFQYCNNFNNEPMGVAFQCMVNPNAYSSLFSERYDCQHDFVQLALPGHTVTRVLDFSDGTPQFRGGCDTEYTVEADNKLDSIVVTDPHGTRYVFGAPYEDQPTDWKGGTQRITWALREIRAQSGSAIRLSWTLRTHSYANPTILGGYSFIDKLNIYEWCNSGLDPTSFYSDQYEDAIFHTIDNCYYFISLKSISFEGGEMSFEYGTGAGPLLTALAVKNDAETILTAQMEYDAYKCRLQKIWISNQGTYLMEYKDGSQSRPDTNAQDWWGYYNGVNNPCLTPYIRLKRYMWDHQDNGEYFDVGYADRSVNAEAMQNNILTKITYPTGGYSRFEYEPHSFTPRREEEGDSEIASNTNPRLDKGGGLRVKLIENCPAKDSGEKQTVRYEYSPAVVKAVPSASTFIDITDAAMSLANVPYSTGRIGYARSVNIQPFSDYMRYDWGETPIWYETVKAIYDEGCIVYRHKDLIRPNTIIKRYGKRLHQDITKLFSNGPQLVAKEIYSATDDGSRLVEKDSMEYSIAEGHVISSTYISRALIQIGSTASFAAPDFENSYQVFGCAYGMTCNIDYDPYEILWFGICSRSERLVHSTHTEYTENGEYSTTQEFAYVPRTSLLSAVTTTGSTGEQRTTVLTYPGLADTGMEGRLAAARMTGVPVKETMTYRTARTSTRAEYCRAENGAFRMQRTVTSFGESDRAGSLLSPQCVYTPDGLLAGATDADGRSTSWIWDSYGLYPMWKVDGVAYSDLAAANNATAGWKPAAIEKPELAGGLATRYTYRHLVGLRVATAPWGTQIQYSYGTDLRLAAVSRNGTNLQQYTYNIGHDTENSVSTREYLSDDGRMHETAEFYDGLGRATRLRDNTTGIETLTQRDAMGRVYRQSMPGSDAPDEYAWVLTGYEPSPRALTQSTTKAGELWHTLGKSVRTRRLTNTASGDYCSPRHEATASGIAARPAYAPGTLLVEETEDEDGHTTRVFTDRDGLVVMTAEGRGADMLATHRVYDDYGRLRYVLPPGMEAGDYAATDTELLEKAFVYAYDGCGRLVSAKTPGCLPSLTRYSRGGRVIARHPSGMEAGKWLVGFFDRYGRTVLSAVATASEEQLAAYADSLPVASYTGDNPAYGGYSFDHEPGFSTVEPQEAVYYDSYSFISDLDVENDNFLRFDATAIQPLGLESGRRDWLAGDVAATYYNRDGFVCRCHELLGGDTRSVVYTRDRSGAVLREVEQFVRHDGDTFDRVTANTYDDAGRLTRCDVTENGRTATMQYTYDSRGRRSGEKLSNGVRREFVYDIHGWLSEAHTRVPLNITLRDSLIIKPFRPVLYYGAISPINPDSIINTQPVRHAILYTDHLLYADGAEPRYSGCPSARVTSLGGRYDYRYDAHDRLTEAPYTPGANAPDGEDFSTAYTYDAAGNPLSVVRHGIVDMADDSESFGVLDRLAYSYDGNRVVEVENDCEGQQFYGRTGYPAAAGSYEWDDAGRMTADGARLISKITYDYRDLPKAVQLADGTTEANTYDAAGLLRSVSTEQRLGSLRRFTLREYVADRVFLGYSLESRMVYSYFPGGYFDADGAPHFLHTDYQGSVVMETDSAGCIEQHTAYYPYGEPHREPAGQPILYAGKERLRTTADYNFDARRFCASTILMTVPDPSASSFHELSPYVYCGANPIRNVDLTGRKFTEDSWEFVNKLMAETKQQIANYKKRINNKTKDFFDGIQSGKLSLSKLERRANKINADIQKRDAYEQIVNEINVLANSTQLYDIRFDTSHNKPADIMSGLGGRTYNTSVYDSKTNVFEMTVGDHHVGSIAHELKHAYQFETGLFSSGKTANPFYDQTDELDAYTRESLFRATSYSRQLPPNYNFLPKESRGLIEGEIYDEYLMQNLSNNTGSAFRWKGKTYKPQE